MAEGHGRRRDGLLRRPRPFGPLQVPPAAFLLLPRACSAYSVGAPPPSPSIVRGVAILLAAARRLARPAAAVRGGALSAALLAACAAAALATALSLRPRPRRSASAATPGHRRLRAQAARAPGLGGAGGGELRLVAGYCAVEGRHLRVVALQLSAPPRGASFWCAAARASSRSRCSPRSGARRGADGAAARSPSPSSRRRCSGRTRASTRSTPTSCCAVIAPPPVDAQGAGVARRLSYSADDAARRRATRGSSPRPPRGHRRSQPCGWASSSRRAWSLGVALPRRLKAIPWPVDASASTSLLPPRSPPGAAATHARRPPRRRGRPP